jgi:hypothetical protein
MTPPLEFSFGLLFENDRDYPLFFGRDPTTASNPLKAHQLFQPRRIRWTIQVVEARSRSRSSASTSLCCNPCAVNSVLAELAASPSHA